MLSRHLVALALAATSLAAQTEFLLRGGPQGAPAIEIPAARVAPDDPAETFGRYRVAIDGGTLRSLGEGVPNWTARLNDDQRVSRMVASGHRGIVLPADAKGQPLPFLRVLDLGSGTWLQDLTPTPLTAPLERLRGHTVIVERERVALLSFAGVEQATHAVIDAFSLSRAEPNWSRTLPLDEPLGVGLTTPRPADQALQWLDECLLVCATSRDPLHLLSPYSGRTVWSVARIWEFRRGFIGPSVCAYTLGRFGFDPWPTPDANFMAAQRAKLDARWMQSIQAGPVVVRRRASANDDHPFMGRHDAYSVFVVVGRRAVDQTDLETDTVVYEFNEAGQPVAIGNLPLPVLDGSHVTTTERATWQTESGGMVCLSPATFGAGSPSMGSDNPDRLVHIAWLRQFAGARNDKFLAPAQWRELPVRCGSALLWRTDQNDHQPRLTLHATSLHDGSTGDWQVLAGKDGAAVPLRRLSARGDTLIAHVGDDTTARRVEFDLLGHPSFGARAHDAAAAREQSLQTARAMLKAGRKNAADQSPLFDAVGSSDTSVLRALLELGADPKAKSPSDWTPLMYAACYGSAEAVDALIPVSDLGARDNNCGGQSVLIWASNSTRQAHQKMRALLDAGADANFGTPKGWSPLMACASAGKLLGVELLLARGARSDARDADGKTAADHARSREHTALAELLDTARR